MDYPQVALDFMNRDHAEFITLRETLLDLLARQAADSEVDTALDKLLQHTRHHFSAEEQHMRDASFPPYPVHKGEHDNVLADMQNRIAQWQQHRDKAALQDYLEHALIDWFIHHVGMMDFVTARLIASRQQPR